MTGEALNVVFTGPAILEDGRLIPRSNLVAACKQFGAIQVQPRVRGDTDLLVASRTDTVKAKSAAASGIMVLSYQTFVDRHLCGACLPEDGEVDRFTDSVWNPAWSPEGNGLLALMDQL